MKYLILALTAVAATFGAFLLTTMGLDYMDPEIGHGLHPIIAFPLATLMLSLIGVLVALLISAERDPSDEQNRARAELSKQGIYVPPWPKLDD